jgi:hypothetical protein
MDFEIFTMVPTVGAGSPGSGTCMWMISAGWLLLFLFFHNWPSRLFFIFGTN